MKDSDRDMGRVGRQDEDKTSTSRAGWWCLRLESDSPTSEEGTKRTQR